MTNQVLDGLELFIINALICFRVSSCLWKIYLAYREKQAVLSSQDVPVELANYLKADLFEKSKKYHLKCIVINCVYAVYNTVLWSIWISFDGLKVFWEWAGFFSMSEWSQTAYFLFILTYLRGLSLLPLKYYQVFYIEKPFGAKSETKSVKEFIQKELDHCHEAATAQILLSIVVLKVIDLTDGLFYIYMSLLAFVSEVALLTLYAEYIVGMMSHSSLPEGGLKKKLDSLAEKVQFPTSRIIVLNGDDIIGGNAYFVGLFRGKRIVLYKGLLTGHIEKVFWRPWKTYTNDELTGIVAHELGHWKLNHIPQKLAFHQVVLFFELLFASKLMEIESLYEIFGFIEEKPRIIGLIITLHILMQPFSFIIKYLSRVISRSHESEADDFAKRQGYGPPLANALSKVYGKLLVFPNPDPLYVDFYYTHPNIIQRIRSLKEKKPSSI